MKFIKGTYKFKVFRAKSEKVKSNFSRGLRIKKENEE